MILNQLGNLRDHPNPLSLADWPIPAPAAKELLIRVSVCGVCHTELDEIEGRTPPPELPIVLGHQVVGRVEEAGGKTIKFQSGDRVGVAWIFSACGHCEYCRSGQENLCAEFQATGRDAPGGYAEYLTVPEAFAYAIPTELTDQHTAPLLCAGAIGYRSLRLTQLRNGQRLGLTGFGASGHLVMKVVQQQFPETQVYVFARSESEQVFARSLGAVWAGGTDAMPPELLDAIIDTTPAWKPVVEALNCLKPGGRLVINAIRKEHGDQDYLQHLSYPDHLWMEKEIKSVANITRRDVQDFLQLAAQIPIQPEVQEYPLEEANEALHALQGGAVRGAKVLRVASG